MANVKISQLTAAAAASDTQEFEVNDSLTSKKVTGAQIKAYVKTGLATTDISGLTASATELNVLDNIATNGLVARTGSGTGAARTITGTSNQITVTNGDGASGNPTIAAVVASQAEAEAGTDTTKLMTPQRVSQAITALSQSGGMTLLGTLTTTSGSTQTLSSLNLTNYKMLYLDFNGVSHNSGSSQTISFGSAQIAAGVSAANAVYGFAYVSLNSGLSTSVVSRNALPTSSYAEGTNALTGYSTATTSVSLTVGGGTFDAGSVRIFGVK